MEAELNRKLRTAVWAAHSLFNRGKTSGSSANMSFLHDGNIYITASGTCFGTLDVDDFVSVPFNGEYSGAVKPSKEFPLHLYYYQHDPEVQAIIHTHGPYAELWSCRKFDKNIDVIPSYTPYLKMKVGKIGLIPYGKPGSAELFKNFRENLDTGDAYLLKNHGGIVGGKSIMDAFYSIEELEDSARIACMTDTTAVYDIIE